MIFFSMQKTAYEMRISDWSSVVCSSDLPQFFEPIPRRTNVMARVPGRDADKPALVLHGHLDVVPAIAADWSVDPFAGEIREGLLWGRGAVDRKNMTAMILTAVARITRPGHLPSRDTLPAFFSVAETGGVE